jgi:hypothetical protein
MDVEVKVKVEVEATPNIYMHLRIIRHDHLADGMPIEHCLGRDMAIAKQ